MTDLTSKFSQLDAFSKKEVIDFVDFLLAKNVKSKKSAASDFKKKIMKVSVWSDSDIDVIIQNQQNINQWKAPEW
jgi:hypothetical protein